MDSSARNDSPVGDEGRSVRGYDAVVIDLLTGRRSWRYGFTDAPVPDAVVDEIVRGGLVAPSSKNAQPWRLHVVRDRAVIGELAEAVARAKDPEQYVPSDPTTGEPRPDWPSTVSESATALRTAALAIFVENRGEFSHGRQTVARAPRDAIGGALIGYGLEMVGLGACVMAMWTVALSHGLSAVFMGDVAIADDEISARLEIAGDLVGVLAIGTAGSGEPAPRRIKDDRVVRHDRLACDGA